MVSTVLIGYCDLDADIDVIRMYMCLSVMWAR